MPFAAYQEVRPWAKAIREAVLSRRMPPWPADPHFGRFSNDRSLEQQEIDLISARVAGGSPEGDARHSRHPEGEENQYRLCL